MTHVLLLVLSLFVSPEQAEGLRTTAPSYLTLEQAAKHLAAAEYAGATYNVDADLLLSIAWHESRYQAAARTAEPGHKVSCGVMTPIPKEHCTAPSLLEGYLEGAAHLRAWVDAAHGDMRTALLGYAGGYRMIQACASGEVLATRGGRDVDLCAVVGVFQGRALWIRRARTRAAS